MSPEKAFYYFVAINGYSDVDVYGKSFDASNYERAMADEFERNRYRERIRARIADEVRKIDFSQKFTFVAQARLGEYSFGSHSFPIVWLGEWLRICIGAQSYTGACTFLEASGFRVQDAVNGNDFNWALPMSESDANAFVKSRSTARPGEVDRRITLRITYSVVKKRPEFSPFIYSVEAYSDQSLTGRLGVIPKTNSVGASTAEELRLAAVAAQTVTKEIGTYRNMIEYRNNSGQVLIYPPQFRQKYPQLFGTITLTDVGVTSFDEQPGVSAKTRTFNFFHSPTTSLWRGNGSDFSDPNRKIYSVVWRSFQKPYASFQFDRKQERDRFFVDLTQALQAWKTKYAPFQFAAGEVKIYQQCEINSSGSFGPCSESTLSEGKPVWQTPSYKVTVESLERDGNDYVAALAFENLTDKKLDIGWQEKSNQLPDAVGPYLIDETGEKYFAKGTDSGNIINDGMTWLWKSHKGILPKSKLISRFVFSGNGNGKIFTLEAKGMEDLATRSITIEGLKVTSPSEVIDPAGTSVLASSDSTPVARSTADRSEPTRAAALSLPQPQLVFAGKEDFQSRGSWFTSYLFDVSNRTEYPAAIFAPAPDLPPCGLNANASRSWVDIYARDGKRLYGYCALRSSDDLKGLSFAIPKGETPPGFVYIIINDRKLNKELKSNLVSTSAP